MRIYVWGTGRYYQKIKEAVYKNNEVRLIDSNLDKKGSLIDEHIIETPNTIDQEWCDYLVVAVKDNEEIILQLKRMGVPASKIMLFEEAVKYFTCMPSIHHDGKMIGWEEWFKLSIKKRIILAVHELSHTGVPIVVKRMATLLKEMDYDVLVLAYAGGTLEKTFQEERIDYAINFWLVLDNNLELKELYSVEYMIVCTVAASRTVDYFNYYRRPIILWGHESEKKIFDEYPRPHAKNVQYVAVADRAKNAMITYWGLKSDEILNLNYFFDDVKKEKTKKYKIAVIGALCPRKAQDILGEAWESMPIKLREMCDVALVGSTTQTEYVNFIRNKYPELEIWGELPEEKVNELYCDIDLLICPSRDDPMPLVVTQAFQYGVPVVISDAVGQCKYVNNRINGFTFKNENVEELKDTLTWILSNVECAKKVGLAGKSIFADNFSKNNTKSQLESIFRKNYRAYIPTYDRVAIYCFYDNAGILSKVTEEQIKDLRSQVDYLIVVVNGIIREEASNALQSIADYYIKRENQGLDAGAYAAAMNNDTCIRYIRNCHNLVLCNNSFYGPFSGFEKIFTQMKDTDADFWGLSTREYDYNPHVQSFFIVFSDKLIREGIVFEYFNKHILNRELSYKEVCATFENGLSWELLSRGYRMGAIAKMCDCEPYTNPLGYMDICGVSIIKKKAFSSEFATEKRVYRVLAYIRDEYKYAHTEWLVDDINRLYNLSINVDKIPGKSNFFITADSQCTSRKQIVDFIKANGQVYIYGMGKKAQNIFNFFFFYRDNPALKGFVVSDNQVIDQKMFEGYPIYHWSELKNEMPAVIVCANKQNSEDIYDNIGISNNILYLWR